MFDTNIISYTLKHPATPFAERYRSIPKFESCISTVVKAELLYGVARRPTEAHLPALVAAALSSLQIVSWDSHCARAHADFRNRLQKLGRCMTFADSMIAAHALALNLVLVTNDFAFTNIPGLLTESWAIEPGYAYK